MVSSTGHHTIQNNRFPKHILHMQRKALQADLFVDCKSGHMGQNNGVEYLGTWACRVLDVAWKRIANMLQEA